MRKKKQPNTVVVRALRTSQADGVPVYAFFIAGADLLRVAEISRIHRSSAGDLNGFQREEIRRHVSSITEFLNSGPVLFPNAIILALAPNANFIGSRGKEPNGSTTVSKMGTLYIPAPLEGAKSAWIVDGQQRSLALADATNKDFPVPVIAFCSDDIMVHREQFILVNKAKPLSARLVDELLPEIDAHLPRELAARKVPSALVNLLNQSPNSPFHNLISRTAENEQSSGVVTDSVLVKQIKAQIESPLGALAPFRFGDSEQYDTTAMLDALILYWSAVKEVFPKAWGLHPTKSRLMHSVGLYAMSSLMDRICARAPHGKPLRPYFVHALKAIRPGCCWTEGIWPDIHREWNSLESVHRDIKSLTEQLLRLDARALKEAAK